MSGCLALKEPILWPESHEINLLLLPERAAKSPHIGQKNLPIFVARKMAAKRPDVLLKRQRDGCNMSSHRPTNYLLLLPERWLKKVRKSG